MKLPAWQRSLKGTASGRKRPIQDTALAVCNARGAHLADANVLWGFRLPSVSRPSDMGELAKVVIGATDAHPEATDVVIIDPAYLCLMDGATQRLQASNVFDMGPLLLGRRERGRRHVTCTPCSVAADRDRRQTNRGRATSKWITTLGDKRSASALAAAVEETIRACGGMRRFVQRWRQAPDIAWREGRWASVLRAHGLVMKMVMAATELARGPDSLTDAELSAALDARVLRMGQENPVIAVEAFRRLGWKVTRMSDDDSDQEKDGI